MTVLLCQHQQILVRVLLRVLLGRRNVFKDAASLAAEAFSNSDRCCLAGWHVSALVSNNVSKLGGSFSQWSSVQAVPTIVTTVSAGTMSTVTAFSRPINSHAHMQSYNNLMQNVPHKRSRPLTPSIIVITR